MKGSKTFFVCNECDYRASKWMGKCPSCGAWNSFSEEQSEPEPVVGKRKAPRVCAPDEGNPAMAFGDLELPEYMRQSTGMGEVDRVLGGGLVLGSVVLLSGEPGIGKSTLLLQISDALGLNKKVLYVSGEESRGQIKLRAQRLHVQGSRLYVLTETNVSKILAQAERLKPDIIIVDSIQTIYQDEISSSPGSVTQVKAVTEAFIAKAKSEGISVLMVGHVNKEGSIAGPKVLEHMVDAVIYFEGEKQQSYRIIRAIKNRFGSTNEIGVFTMGDHGLCEVENPSEMLISGRPLNVSGNCTVCIMEGTRPILAEIQALVARTSFPVPRRTSAGIDYNRIALLIAVLEKRLGLPFHTNDVYLNVVGGLRIDEPGADLAIVMALISGIKDIPLPDDLLAVGEVGLAGECRSVSNAEQRIREAARIGFRRIIIPARNADKLNSDDFDIEIIPAKSVFDVLKLFPVKKD